jgi:cytochrome c peroxidase
MGLLAALSLRWAVAVATFQAPPVPLGLPPEARAGHAPEWAELGARLFADARLSRDGSTSCASCHRPELAFADERARSRGVAGRETERNTPTLLNRALGRSFSFDGRAGSLEEQVLLPIANPREMDLALEEAVALLAGDAGYAAEFARLGGAPPDAAALARALAAHVRTLLAGDSPVDRFRAGDFAALSDEARAGLWFFESRGRCWRCHSGPNFSDEAFHNTGVGVRLVNGVPQPEPGRAAVSGDPADRGRFKTPTLRGVALTAPYMHDGSLATLGEVLEFYRQGGHPNPLLDPELLPLEMSAADARNLEAFLRALSPAQGR